MIKKASRQNWMFISLFLLISLWAIVCFLQIWPKFYWSNPHVKTLVCGLSGLSMIYIAISATHRYLAKTSSRHNKMMWGIVANQLFTMGITFLMYVGIILFLIMINKALAL